MKKTEVYSFADGSRFQPGAVKDPIAVGKRIDELRKQAKGELQPEDLLKDAKSKASPLHSFFEWNDGKAAEQHRLAQARGLIRAVVCMYTSNTAPAVPMRAFVHIADAGAPHYRELSHAMSQKRTRDIVLIQAWREFKSWRAKYAELKEFASLFEVADKIERKIAA